jgi:hypothetical protein
MFVPLVGSDTPGPGVSEPTRGTNILDLIVTNQPSSFRRTEIIPGVSEPTCSDTPEIISILRKLDGWFVTIRSKMFVPLVQLEAQTS